MSLKLFVFNIENAPQSREEFMRCFDGKIGEPSEIKNNREEHLNPGLKEWLKDMEVLYPQDNRSLSETMDQPSSESGYRIGEDGILITYSGSGIWEVYKNASNLALKHGLGLYKTSSRNQDILLPYHGRLKPIDRGIEPSLPVWARIPLFIVGYLVMAGIFSFIGMVIAGVPLNSTETIPDMELSQLLILEMASLLALIPVVWFFRIVVDKKSILSMGFSTQKKLKDVLSGLIIAAGIMGIGSLFLTVSGFASFSLERLNLNSLFINFLLFTLVAFHEEILVRGYILNNLLGSMNKFLALFISSILFASFHLFNSNISILAMVNLVIAGIILGSAYIYNRNLWYPISLHLFWNFFQGPVLGYEVSGQKTDSIFSQALTGSNLITGDEFGFEGSVVCSVLTLSASILIILYFRKKNFRNQEK